MNEKEINLDNFDFYLELRPKSFDLNEGYKPVSFRLKIVKTISFIFSYKKLQ